MRDWNAIVTERLGHLHLRKSVTNEVVEEIADHLEQTYEALRSNGLDDELAALRALETCTDWEQLRYAVDNSRRDAMNERTQKVVLPGAVAIAISMLPDAVASLTSYRPTIHWLNAYGFFVLPSLTWMLTYVTAGAVGGYMSKRAGGTRMQQALAALFPAIIMTALFGGIFVADAIARVVVNHQQPPLTIMGSAAAGYLITSVLMPSIFYLIGASWFLLRQGNNNSSVSA
jgi:hypothetical protein